MKRPQNPYPESIFTEPTKEQWEEFHKVLGEKGLSGTSFAGSIGRLIWDNCCNEWDKVLEEVK